MKWNPFKNLGPGTLVAAAFIGPGTVTMCTKAGGSYGFALIWALVLSVVATLFLQEMAARLGLVTGKGLAAVIKDQLKKPLLKVGAIGLIIAAILIGNSAYQGGNIGGGVLGLSTIFPSTTITIGSISFNYLIVIFAAIAFMALYIGKYRTIERILILLVITMSAAFLITAILTLPNILAVLKGALIPSLPSGSLLTIIGLIGTTVVPYNLFLHASLVNEKWQGSDDSLDAKLKSSKRDTFFSILLGGVVSISIIICAAAVESGELNNAGDLAQGLTPLFGEFARYFLGIGLFAAGITSAITAPMAAAYVAQECFDWEKDSTSFRFRAVWMTVLFIGTFFALSGIKPVELIQFAQIANGVLMPIIALFLLWIASQSTIMKKYVNATYQTLIGLVIVLITIGLLIKTIYGLYYAG